MTAWERTLAAAWQHGTAEDEDDARDAARQRAARDLLDEQER